MNRIFGKKKPEAPRVNISDVGTKVDGRITDLDLKVRGAAMGLEYRAVIDEFAPWLLRLQIEKLDQELRKYRDQVCHMGRLC